MTIRCFLMMTACLSCLGCRAADRSSPQDAATSSAGDPQTTRVEAQSAAGSTVVYAYYFHRTFRCISCLTMEEMAARAIEEHFAPRIRNGQVVWMAVNIEDPATEPLRQQLDVGSNGLVLVRMENGAYRDSKTLDALWGLLDRPDAFSKYLVDQVNARLGTAQER
jgi:hypothetical protein